MLEVGFADELNEIVKYCPKSRQTMLFSATMTDNVDELIRLSLNRPVKLMIDSIKSTNTKLIQEFIRIREYQEKNREIILLILCKKYFKHKVIIFFRTKSVAHEMKVIFGLLGLKASELHGNLSQEQVSFMSKTGILEFSFDYMLIYIYLLKNDFTETGSLRSISRW